MIDMHSHILPSIDDGATSVNEAFKLIEEAKKVGFESIVLTSHYIEGYYEADIDRREALAKSLVDNLAAKDVNIYLGNEIYISENIMSLLEGGKASTINNTSYVLFELPLNQEPMFLFNIIYEMIQNKLVPILAHPERYTFVQQNPEIIYDLIQRGVLMQANFGSIIGEYGEKAQILVKKLLQNNMVHFLGSDVHRENTIYPKIPKILSELNKLISQDKIQELTSVNPKLVLQNKRIDIDEPHEIDFNFIKKLIMKLKKWAKGTGSEISDPVPFAHFCSFFLFFVSKKLEKSYIILA